MKKRMRKWLNTAMLGVLLTNSILGPVVQAVDISMTSTTETSSLSTTEPSGENTSATTTAPVSQGQDSETPSTSADSSTSSTTSTQPEEPAATPEEEEPLVVTPTTPLTEAKETTAETLAKQAIPQAFSAVMLRVAALPPSEGDGTKIETIKLEWLTADTTDDSKAENLFQKWEDNKTKNVRLRVSYSLSGDEDYEPGVIQIRVPKTVFETREDNHIGRITWAVPEAPDTSGIFQYYLDEGDKSDPLDDTYVLTNTRKLSAASQGYIEGTITDLIPHEIRDYVTGYKAYVDANIQVTTHLGNALTLASNQLSAEVDTVSILSRATKYDRGWYKTYPTNFPAELKPASPDDYIYVYWDSEVFAPEKNNQPSTVSFTDTISSGGIVLGYDYDGKVTKGTGTNTITGEIGKDTTVKWPSYTNAERRERVIVYTAYPKTAFPDLENGKQYQVTNNIVYTLTDTDDQQVSRVSATAREELYERVVQPSTTARYYLGKNANPYRYDTALSLLQKGLDAQVTYRIHGGSYAYSDVKKGEDGSIDSYRLQINDDKVWLRQKNPLTSEDYEFSHLTFTVPRLQSVQKATDQPSGYYEGQDGSLFYGTVPVGSFYYVDTKDVAQAPVYTVKGKTATGTYLTLATVAFASGKPQIAPQNGATAIGSRLVFPEGIVDYQVDMDVQTPGFHYGFTVGVKLHSTAEMRKRIEDLVETTSDPALYLSNQARAEVRTHTGTSLGKLSYTGEAVLKGIYPAADLDKSVTYTNDVIARTVRLRYTSTANLRTGATSKEVLDQAIAEGAYAEEKETTWYDLLPVGVVPDMTSLAGRPGDVITEARAIANYKNTGRTLLIVKMKLTPQYHYPTDESIPYELRQRYLYDRPRLSFSANYSWQSLKNYGANLTNVIAYESANDKLGFLKDFKGEPDNPLAGNNSESKAAVGTAASLMTNLNPDRDTPSFIYASASEQIVAGIYAVTSLIKQVDVNNQGIYTDGRSATLPRNVYEGGVYRYHLEVTSAAGERTEDIIFYDILESYTPIETDADRGDFQWKGIFQGVDISDFARYGVTPTVYYSTVKNLHISEGDRAQADLTDRSIWSTTMPADKSTITAVAIDARKKTDGTPFVLPEDSNVSAYINMRAPRVDAIRGLNPKESYYDTALGAGMTEAGLSGGVHAYNNVKMSTTSIGAAGQTTRNLLIESNYTKVGLQPYRIIVNKAWDDDNDRDRIRTKSVRIRVLANGKDSGRSIELSAANNWTYTFDDLEMVTADGLPIRYSITEDPVPGYTLKLSNTIHTPTGMTVNAVNVHEPEKVIISGIKRWVGEDATASRPDSIRVNLYADGTQIQTKEVRPDETGAWNYRFDNLFKYKDGQEIRYTVEEPDYIPGYVSAVDGTNLINTYDPHADIVFTKTVANPAEPLKNHTYDFRFSFRRSDGTEDLDTYRYTTSDGRTGTIRSGGTISLKAEQTVTVKDVRSEQTYTIQEVEKPGYTVTGENLTGTLQAGKTYTATATNTYKATGEITLDAQKVLRNRRLRAYQFIFEVMDETGQVIRTGSNTIDGKVVFKPLTYTEKDHGKTYTYRIRERDAGLPGYVYDTHEEIVTVTVTDNGDGTITATPRYDRDGAVFTNRYEIKENLSLSAWKVMLHDQKLIEGAYTFELYKEGEASPLATATNGKDGRIDFTGLSFTQDDIGKTYTYIAKEKAGTNPDITYDTTTIRYQVSVTDGGEGKLALATTVQDQHTADVDNNPATGIFVNSYKPGSLKIQKTILSGDPVKTFRFKIKLKGPNGASLPAGQVNGTIGTAPSQQENPLYTLVLRINDNGKDTDYVKKLSEPFGEFDVPEGFTNWKKPSGQSIALKETKYNYLKDAFGGIYIYEVGQPGKALLTAEDFTENRLVLTGERKQQGTARSGNNLAAKARSQKPASNTSILETTVSAVASLFKGVTVHAATITSTGTVVETGTTGTVTWEIYSDGVLYFKPTNGFTGTMASGSTSNTNSWRDHQDKFTKVTVAKGVKAPENSSSLFANLSNVTDMDLENLDVSGTRNMEYMFSNVRKLKTLHVSGWNTGNVKDMSSMFEDATSLTSLPVEKWDVSKVTDMSLMFDDTKNLTSLPVQNWDVGNVTNMRRMFRSTTKLSSLPTETWNVSNVRTMDSMFYGASGLTNLPVQNWDVGNVRNMEYMFYGASGLTNLPVQNWDVGSVLDMSGMFSGAHSLTSLPVEHWNVGNVTNMRHMFNEARSLTSLPVEHWNVGNVTNMRYMFNDARSLTSLPVEHWNVGNVKDMRHMFSSASSLISLPVQNWNVGNVTSMWNMFNDARSLTSLPVQNWNVGNVTNMSRLFQNARNLVSLPVQNWDVGSVTDMSGMFSGTSNLSEINLSSWDVSKVSRMSDIFAYSGIKNLDLSNFHTPELRQFARGFMSMSSLETLDISQMDLTNLDSWGVSNGFAYSRNLKKVKLPPTISLADTNLATPPKNATYTGKWIREDRAYGPFTANELMKQYTPDMAGTWIWEEAPQDYTLAFDANTGSGSMPVQTLTRGQVYTLPLATFTKNGYRFKEWNTRPDGRGTSYQADQSVTDLTEAGKTITLYAVWELVDPSVTIQDGEFEVTLRGGETFTLPNLPAGTSYEVYEEAEKGWVLVDSHGTTGIIEANKTSTASFVNDYQKGKTSVQLGGQKLLDGAPASGYRFTFKKDGQLLETVTSSEGGGFRFATIVYDQAGTYTYEVAEQAGDDVSIDYDSHTETITVTVVDDGQGNLLATVSKENRDIVFANRKKKGSLSITKAVEGSQNQDKTFTIQVKLNNSPTDVREFQFKAGQTQTINDLPYGTTYEVTETNLPAGYSLVSIANETGHIHQDTTLATVTNRYQATGTANITATKRLDNTEDPARQLKANEFTFELVDPGAKANDPSDDTVVATATNDEYGNIAFGAVTFTKAGTYRYKLRESKGLDTTVAYDAHEEDVTVTATDQGEGKLQVSVTYDADGAVFINAIKPPTTTPDPKLGSVKIIKKVDRLTDVNKQTDFDLLIHIKDKNGEILLNRFAYTSNKREAGTIASDETLQIRHDETIQIVNLPEGATVTATEQVPAGYTLDRQSKTTATVTLAKIDEIRLANHYNPTGTWKPTGTKRLEGGNLANYRFAFLVVDENGRQVQRALSDTSGQIQFTDISYTYDDIGKTYTYRVTEEKGNELGIAYDSTIYTYKVKITDDGSGKIIAQVQEMTSSKTGNRPSQADFTNRTVRLPETGGMGSLIWYALGASIILITYFFYRREDDERTAA
ncbi:BspA family leucine-rich repeat surface protein [Streptococcus sp. E17BB]|uniref:BspA family leucine-rich repeat surface protein n=1 Tax=Streptococcus sp. E17BB TaxID=3278714 RepID=UPI00359E7513